MQLVLSYIEFKGKGEYTNLKEVYEISKYVISTEFDQQYKELWEIIGTINNKSVSVIIPKPKHMVALSETCYTVRYETLQDYMQAVDTLTASLQP